ncbi:hypothetical protein SDC9_11672 [bioreactor metagenome]|uniref:Uncharacterized protein n=1 Tax=bioreactor metagenome TaxID=1076179 RepID=A0A644TGM2_9ZZZZ
MKRGLVLLLVFVSIISISAETLTGFWGIPWGTPIAEIETTMAGKGYKAAAKTSTGYIYKNILFAGRNGDAFFVLKDERLMGGSFRFVPKKKKVYDSYQSLKSDLIDKYGVQTYEQEEYLPPFFKGLRDPEDAIVSNKVRLSTAWEFEDKNLILLHIENDEDKQIITIFLDYYNAVAMKENKQSVLSDL